MVDETESPGRLRRQGRRRRRPHRRQHRPGQRRASGTTHPEDDLGSFHAGFGVEATGTTGEDTPSIARLLHRRLRHRGHQRRRLRRATTTSSAPTSRSTSAAPAAGQDNLTVTSTLGDGDDLKDVFTGTSTVVDACPRGLQNAPRRHAVQVRHPGRGPPAVPLLRRDRPAHRLEQRRDAGHRQGPPGRRRLHGQDPRRRSTTSSRTTTTRPPSGAARSTSPRPWPSAARRRRQRRRPASRSTSPARPRDRPTTPQAASAAPT